MDEHTQDVMVALRPITTDWCKIALPHLTLVYAGLKAELAHTDFNELLKASAAIAMDFRVVQLNVKGLELFGSEPNKVEVLTLESTPALMQMQRRVSQWDKSSFGFNAHCTIGPEGSNGDKPLPPALAFDRIMVGWGQEEVTFWLKH